MAISHKQKATQIATVSCFALIAGCCPIGFDEAAVLRPSGKITVTEDGEPAPNVRVLVQRFGHRPHWTPHETWVFQTSERGELAIASEIGTVTNYPLAMHGVGTYAWQVCAEKEGMRSVEWWIGEHEFDRDGELQAQGRDLSLELNPSDEPCDAAILKRRDIVFTGQ